MLFMGQDISAPFQKYDDVCGEHGVVASRDHNRRARHERERIYETEYRMISRDSKFPKMPRQSTPSSELRPGDKQK